MIYSNISSCYCHLTLSPDMNTSTKHTQLLPYSVKHDLIFRIYGSIKKTMKNECKFVSTCYRILTITVTLLQPKVISLCHQCRARPAYTSTQFDQALYCWITNFKFST